MSLLELKVSRDTSGEMDVGQRFTFLVSCYQNHVFFVENYIKFLWITRLYTYLKFCLILQITFGNTFVVKRFSIFFYVTSFSFKVSMFYVNSKDFRLVKFYEISLCINCLHQRFL